MKNSIVKQAYTNQSSNKIHGLYFKTNQSSIQIYATIFFINQNSTQILKEDCIDELLVEYWLKSE